MPSSGSRSRVCDYGPMKIDAASLDTSGLPITHRYNSQILVRPNSSQVRCSLPSGSDRLRTLVQTQQ